MKQTAWPVRLALLLVCLLFIVSALFSSIRIVVNRPAFFYQEYARLDHARYMGMSTEDLTGATMQMIRYMEGSVPSIDIEVTVNGERVSMFNDRERAHMVDVLALYQGWRTVSYVSFGLLALATVLLRKRPGEIARAFLSASKVFVLLLAAIAVWVLFDFSSFWTAFHHLFFTNDLWLLDPATSRMINMMPQQLFYDIVLFVVAVFLVLWAALIIAALAVKRKEKRAGA
ncbi:MAG TPA: TIGR01906 family membrane protein [Feifaniaceae bacterium]|nr:TIGR01906 family membrane protein [Feifaniaceae bacterium]